jgi:hypothetical protein
LFGSADPMVSPTSHTDLLPIIISELVEFAKSLVPAAKGQEPFHGYPHLQAYRLWHATCLAEMGEIALAKRYASALCVDCLLIRLFIGTPMPSIRQFAQPKEVHRGIRTRL